MIFHNLFIINRFHIFTWLLIGSISFPTFAATSSRPGGSGMTWMRTADTLNNGDIVLYDQIGINSYIILNSNLSDTDTFNTIGINYGLFDPLELGYQTTWIKNDRHGSSGIQSHKGILKFRLLGNDDSENYALTFSAFKTASPADKEDKIGTGETEDGAEINFSIYTTDLNYHLTLGSATADAKYYDPDVVYYSVEKQYAHLGLEFNITEKFTFGLEVLQEQSENIDFDKNQIYAFSFQYEPSSALSFDIGTAFGIPEDRSEPAKSIYFGLNYLLGDQPQNTKSKSTPTQTRAVSQTNTTIPVPKTKPAKKPVFKKKPPVKIAKATAPAKPRTFKYMVHIKNGTGSSSTVERITAFLKENGYGVKSIKNISRRHNTEIRYLKRNSKQALRLALKIPGNQDLRLMSSLSGGVDFEIIVGSDIVENLR